MSGDATYIATVVATYWFVSISMVYLNKVLLSSEEFSIDAPLFVTWYQCLITALICCVAGKAGEITRKLPHHSYNQVNNKNDGGNTSPTPRISRKSSFFAQFPKPEFSPKTAKKILPLSFIFVGMIAFNNLCLKHVEVSFYNVARSLTIVFNVLFARVLLGVPTTFRTISCLFIVIFGFAIGIRGEIGFSFRGTLSGILSSLFVSLHSIFTKRVLPIVDDNHWKLTFYNNVNACILLVPLVLIFEWNAMTAAVHSQFVTGLFWSTMTVAGFFGFSIGIVTVLQIKATCPWTHNISGTAKAAVQSIMAFYIWGNTPTVSGVVGILTVLGGSLLYTMVKMSEGKTATAPPLTNKNIDNDEEERVELVPKTTRV
jgi:GDP-fucose transporter C1